ncbi:MAG: hypothetical protein Q6358_02850, partial [Candidatus Brocadiales bacterium]|nr:hypothetical protein [Candidatus Brocadiales bacterium]
MDSPEERNGVEHHVLKVDDKIHRNHRQHNRNPIRQPEVIEKPPSVLQGKYCHTHGSSWKGEAQQKAVKEHHTQIVNPTEHLRNCEP